MTMQGRTSDATAVDGLPGFAAGTRVMTLTGPRAVETLAPGDRVVTRSGAMRLAAVEQRHLPRARVIRVSASALGHDRPEDDIWLAPAQDVLVRDWRAKALAGADRALIAVDRLCDGDYIRPEARRDATFVSLHFDAPQVIYAQGLELTCLPATVSA